MAASVLPLLKPLIGPALDALKGSSNSAAGTAAGSGGATGTGTGTGTATQHSSNTNTNSTGPSSASAQGGSSVLHLNQHFHHTATHEQKTTTSQDQRTTTDVKAESLTTTNATSTTAAGGGASRAPHPPDYLIAFAEDVKETVIGLNRLNLELIHRIETERKERKVADEDEEKKREHLQAQVTQLTDALGAETAARQADVAKLTSALADEIAARQAEVVRLEAALAAAIAGIHDEIRSRVRTDLIHADRVQIGSEWNIGPEQANEQFLCFRHSTFNRIHGDRRAAMNGDGNANIGY